MTAFAVFASGYGSNLQRFIEEFHRPVMPGVVPGIHVLPRRH